MQKYFNKEKYYNEVNVFHKKIKLKIHFKDQINKPKTESDIFRIPTDKTWVVPKNHHTIETFTEAKNNEIIEEIVQIIPPKYSDFQKESKKDLQKDLPERDEIVIVNADKGGAVVLIMDVADYRGVFKTQLNIYNGALLRK